MQKRSGVLIYPFWDSIAGVLAVALDETLLDQSTESVSIEYVPEYGKPELLGELRLSQPRGRPRLQLQCASSLPFFRVPFAPPFRLVFRVFAKSGEIDQQVAIFDDSSPEDRLLLVGGLIWGNAGTSPRLVCGDDMKATNQRGRKALQCRQTADGRFAPAMLIERPPAGWRRVDVETQRVDEPDPLDPDEAQRPREHAEIVIDLSQPLEAAFNETFLIGIHHGVFASRGGDDLDIVNLTDVSSPFIRQDGLQIRVPLGPLVHQSIVVVVSLDGMKLQAGGREQRVAAFLYLGRRSVLDERWSDAFDNGQMQQGRFRNRRPIEIRDGAYLGPAGEAAVDEIQSVLSEARDAPADDPRPEAIFLRTLRGSGINPLNAAELIEHANTIHALQWPRVFRRWQQYLAATGDTEPPGSVLDIINRVQVFERSRGMAVTVNLMPTDDALQSWHAFRKASEPSGVIAV